MKTPKQIRCQLAAGSFEFSRHAFRRAVERNISETEIRQAGAKVIIIEDYPHDKYSPSCLLLGFTQTGRPLHYSGVVCRHRFCENYHTVST